MSLIQSFYKTKALVNNGIFIILCALFLLIAGYFIPDFTGQEFKEQIYTLNGFNTKHNDPANVSDFYLSIKRNNGFLILGTSESTTIKGGNYYDFLNNDKAIETDKFSVLAGAGRTSGMHIPLLLHHRSEVDSLKIIYFINPVYWRADLCDVNLKYWNRYCNYKVITDLNATPQESADFLNPVIAYANKLNWSDKVLFNLEQNIRAARMNYFSDLRYYLFPVEYATQFNFISSSKTDYSNTSKYGQIDYESIDTILNISKDFIHKDWFKPINKSVNYRYEELTSFLKLCENLEIQATFIIGPYNERFIKKYDLNSLADYESTTQHIKQLLIENHVDFIDATDISPVIGAFNDHQHHSSYGAFLIYNKIKNHFYEK